MPYVYVATNFIKYLLNIIILVVGKYSLLVYGEPKVVYKEKTSLT